MVNLGCLYLFVSKSKHDFHFHTKLVTQVANAGWVSLIAELECEMERWSGKWNGTMNIPSCS